MDREEGIGDTVVRAQPFDAVEACKPRLTLNEILLAAVVVVVVVVASVVAAVVGGCCRCIDGGARHRRLLCVAISNVVVLSVAVAVVAVVAVVDAALTPTHRYNRALRDHSAASSTRTSAVPFLHPPA